MKLHNIVFTAELPQTGCTQAVVVTLQDVVAVMLFQFDAFALAVDDVAAFAFEALLAVWADFLFVFRHGLESR